MRRALLLLAACGAPAPAPTASTTTSNVPIAVAVTNVPVPASEYGPPPQLAGDFEAQCQQTEPRALPCMDLLFVAYAAASLGVPAENMSNLKDKHSDDAEARMLHKTNCMGARDFAYMQDIVACWNEQGCDAFAACVGTRTKSFR